MPTFRNTLENAMSVAILVDSARRARRQEVAPAERRIFRALNDAPDAIHAPVWVVMQSGSLGAVFAAAGHLELRGRRRAAVATAVTGTAVWGGVKLAKPIIGRGRPQALLEDVAVRGGRTSGLGYPSGHAAVAMTLAEVATVGCSPARHAAARQVAVATGASRIYVGAHLPLDVAGGLALGSLAGRLVRAWLQRP